MIQQSHYLGRYSEKTINQQDACTTMFIAAQFTIAKTWKQHKCPLKDEWIKEWHIYTMVYSAIKMDEIKPLATLLLLLIAQSCLTL